MLTQSELKVLLDYNPNTGAFTRLVARTHNTKVGPCKEQRHPYGYVLISLGNKMHLAHRLAFLWMTGAWPSKNINLQGKTYYTKVFKTAIEAKCARDELAKTLHPFFNPKRGATNEQF